MNPLHKTPNNPYISPLSIDNIIKSIQLTSIPQLPVPPYTPTLHSLNHYANKVGLAVSSMKYHTTDEGYQIFQGIEHAGYLLFGHGYNTEFTTGHGTRTTYALRGVDWVDVHNIIKYTNPTVVVLQDKREWDIRSGDFRDPNARFINVDSLHSQPSIFKLTILKDAQQRPQYHSDSAREINCHAWIVYYHPRIIHHLAPYTRPQHLIRTYHSIDSNIVPPYSYSSSRPATLVNVLDHLDINRNPTTIDKLGGSNLFLSEDRGGCLLSGAISEAYPLRTKLVKWIRTLPETDYLKHPGYGRSKCHTPQFLQTLSQYKVAICTASRYGYALRKIIEATACGCMILTDLPYDEVLPEIDGNLTRIHPNTDKQTITKIIRRMLDTYDPTLQEQYANRAKIWYDYMAVCARLASDIESLRSTYNK